MTAITPEDVLTGATPSAPQNAYYREQMDTTVETITRQLHEDRRLAHEQGQAGASKRILLDALIEKRNAVAEQAVETVGKQQAGTER